MLKRFILAFFLYAHAAFAASELEEITVLDYDTFILEEGEELSLPSPHVIIRTQGNIEVNGIIRSSGSLTLDSGDHPLILRGKLLSPAHTCELLGKTISLEDNALIDVSSEEGEGGEVRIGRDASTTYVGPDAMILADSLNDGSGGSVSIWSEERTTFLGLISACAKGSGNGGKVEVSGKRGYNFDGQVYRSAENGAKGELLIDPKFAYIKQGGLDSALGNTFASNPDETVFISGESLAAALNGGDVTIQANTDIFFEAKVEAFIYGSRLSLEAGRSITFDTSSLLILNNGALHLKINDENALPSDREEGTAQFQMKSKAGIHTNGGEIVADIGTFGGKQEGLVLLEEGTLNAGSGNISLLGIGTSDEKGGVGILIRGSTTLTTQNLGSIVLNGTGGKAHSSLNHGIQIVGSTDVPVSLRSEEGIIDLNGRGGGDLTGMMNTGIMLSNATLESQSSVTLIGTSGKGVNYNAGIFVTGEATRIIAEDQGIFLSGTGGGSGNSNSGIRIEDGAQINSVGLGGITLNGTIDQGSSYNSGVILSSGTIYANGTGDISLSGVSAATTSSNQGVLVEGESTIQSFGLANITLNGVGVSGLDNNQGVAIMGQDSAIINIDGDITIVGQESDSGEDNQSVLIQSPESVYILGSGVITITP